MQSIDDLIRLREQAIRELLEKREQLKGELEALDQRIKEIDSQLERLGANTVTPSTPSPRPILKHTGVPRTDSNEHAIQTHLVGKSASILETFHALQEKLLALGSDVEFSVAKKHISFKVKGGHSFCGIVSWVSKFTIYIEIRIQDLSDPKQIAEDCSTIGHWANGDTRFEFAPGDDIDYAIGLIRQAYRTQKG